MKWFIVLCFMVDSLNPKTWVFYDVPTTTPEQCLKDRERLINMLLEAGAEVTGYCVYKRSPP
jgi:hypothetical protein